MTDESIASSYGATDHSTQLINGDQQETREQSLDSFYNDQSKGIGDQRTLQSIDDEKSELVENNDEGKEGKPSEETSLSTSNSENQCSRSDEKSQRPTGLSYSNDHETGESIQGAITPSRRQVSFIREANENESCDASLAFDNTHLSSDSLSRVRVITSGSVRYRTHSEAEECNESEQSYCRSNSQLRRRRYTKRGAVVSDSFVNECICCCVII